MCSKMKTMVMLSCNNTHVDTPQHMQVAEACDENTVGVAAILGTTYSGHFDDVAGIDAAIGAHILPRCHHSILP